MSRHAMTLIELLVALALSAMLMTILFAMLGQQNRINERLMNRNSFEPWKRRLTQQIEADYSGCRHVQVRPDRIVFDGYSSSDTDGVYGPSKITWYIVPGEHGNSLLRKRQDLLSNQTDRSVTEFACEGVNNLVAETQLSTDVAPGLLRLRVTFDTKSKSDRTDLPALAAVEKIDLILIRHGGQL